MLGREQRHNPSYSLLERLYITIFGMPIIGLQIRGRNVFSLIPKHRQYNTILDAGSGPGVFTFELARRYPDAKVLGVDMLAESIEACQIIASKTGMTNASFLQTSVEELDDTGPFDLILCVDILEHITDDNVTLRKLSRLLTDKGVLLLHVPAYYRRYPVWRKQVNFDVESHVRPGYTLGTIKHKVEHSGLKILDCGYTYGFLETLSNNISFMITKARMENKMIYSIVFPFLNFLAFLGTRARPQKLGAGIFLVATKT